VTVGRLRECRYGAWYKDQVNGGLFARALKQAAVAVRRANPRVRRFYPLLSAAAG
jgi:hypothetical protein